MGEKKDLVLLDHEMFELSLMKLYNYVYERAHKEAEKLYNYAILVKEE